MTEEAEIKLYISSGCGPCQQVREMVEAGKINVPQLEVIDVSTEAGFPLIEQLGLTKVPTARKGAQTCELSLDDDILVIDCDEHAG